MQILTRDGGYEARSANPLQPWGSTAPPPPSQVGMGAAGVSVNEHTALQIAAVWGSVSLIAESIATLGLQQWRQVGASDAKQIDLSPVIAQPWAEFDQMDFIVQGTLSMLLRGTLWGRIISRDERLYPLQVKLVHPDHARRRRLPENGQIETRYWNQIVPPDDVTMKMAMSVPEGIVGLSPIEYMRNVLGVAHAEDITAGAFYANRARPDGYLSVPEDLDPDETHAMKAAWLEAFQGVGRAGLPAVLTGGTVWKPITMSLADAQFLEQMKLSESVITGRIYRVPPHMLGMVDKDTSWGAGIEQQQIGYVRDTLLPWLKRWEDLMRSWLPPRQFVTFDLSKRLQGDTLQRWSAYQIARVMGAMNNAEVRAAEGLPAVTDPAAVAVLEAYDAPLNSAPVKPASSSGVGPGGDKSN